MQLATTGCSRYPTIMLNHAPALSPDELRKRLRPFCEKHHIHRLELFGSAASGQASPSSDIDLLVTLAESASVSTAELLEMAGEAEELAPFSSVTPLPVVACSVNTSGPSGPAICSAIA